jgi:hypothetical protein
MMAREFQPQFEEWRRECELIDGEMSQLLRAPLTVSEDERRARKFQFASLIERRSSAAGRFLNNHGVMRLSDLRKKDALGRT